MTELTRDIADQIIAAEAVASLLRKSDNTLSLRSREQPPGFVIKLVKGDRNTQRQQFADVMLALIAEANGRDIALNRTHFTFEDIASGAGVGGISPSAHRRVTWERENAANQKSAPAGAEAAPATRLWQAREEAAQRSIVDYQERLIGKLREKLGPDYEVTYGVAEGNPAISITPVSLIDQLLIAVGIVQPEQDKKFATAVMAAFNEVLEREPENGEIVINGERLANVRTIQIVGHTRELGGRSGKGLGR